ncbi:MAG: cob(I)yrinic acid a,c-diamide adenosyltransferase [Chlorobi bacterium]|nr:cob(I)yrinic acid a,c-diamide adenosyltransferase [Chlorobiota bacterium]
MKKSSVYTKTGDKGTTGLIGGTRVPKNDIRLEAYGTIDELNSWMGVLRSYIEEKEITDMVISIQNQLFNIGSYLATDDNASDFRANIKFDEAGITRLEKMMDKMEEKLPPLTGFILPGGHQATGFCHVARTVCRRAERKVTELSEQYEINDWIIRYINRLSDFLFVLSRHLSNYFNVNEIRWNSKL